MFSIKVIITIAAVIAFIIADAIKQKANFIQYIKTGFLQYLLVIGLALAFGILEKLEWFQYALFAGALYFAWKFSGTVLAFFKKKI